MGVNALPVRAFLPKSKELDCETLQKIILLRTHAVAYTDLDLLQCKGELGLTRRAKYASTKMSSHRQRVNAATCSAFMGAAVGNFAT